MSFEKSCNSKSKLVLILAALFFCIFQNNLLANGSRANSDVDLQDKFSLELETQDLPPSLTRNDLFKLLVEYHAMTAWSNEDNVTSTWPNYEKLKSIIKQELESDLNVRNPSVQHLLKESQKYMKVFWKNGGCQSKDAYKHGYKARYLLERAHDINTNDMLVIDELVEVLQSLYPLNPKYCSSVTDGVSETVYLGAIRPTEMWGFKALNIYSQKKEAISRGKKIWLTICQLRQKQYELIKIKTSAGEPPTWDDFVRIIDLIVLLSNINPEEAKPAAEWLKKHSKKGGWTSFYREISKCLEALDKKLAVHLHIYIPANAKLADWILFTRRLPSFRGPDPNGCGLIFIPKEEQKLRETLNNIHKNTRN